MRVKRPDIATPPTTKTTNYCCSFFVFSTVPSLIVRSTCPKQYISNSQTSFFVIGNEVFGFAKKLIRVFSFCSFQLTIGQEVDEYLKTFENNKESQDNENQLKN